MNKSIIDEIGYDAFQQVKVAAISFDVRANG